MNKKKPEWKVGDRVRWVRELEVIAVHEEEVRVEDGPGSWAPIDEIYPVTDPAAPTVEDVLEAAGEAMGQIRAIYPHFGYDEEWILNRARQLRAEREGPK